MPSRRILVLLLVGAGWMVLWQSGGCTEEYRPPLLGGTWGTSRVGGTTFTASPGPSFRETTLQDRVFVEGQVVTTVAYNVDDMSRVPRAIDFNDDGKVDPVVGYQQDQVGVVQILLSFGDTGTVEYESLTLDGGENDWPVLSDLAVGDIDGDGSLDVIIGTGKGIIYLRHPANASRTQVLSEWGQANGALEIISGTSDALSDEELESLVATALADSKVDPSNYLPIVSQVYRSVEIGDFDNDGHNDVIASRQLTVDMKPLVSVLPEIIISRGSLQLLISPGATTTGEYWTGVVIGQHERHSVLDREGASDVRAVDLDGDGDLDVISVAADDNNAQISWFENPGGPGGIDPAAVWTQHRIGSVRGAVAVDVADLTGDGRVDVVAISPVQMQMVLFVQPESGPRQGYDWYSAAIVTFESYEPRSVKALDLTNDGLVDLVVAGTGGAVRYFEPGATPIEAWVGHRVANLDPAGDVGLLGFGDLDGDADLDLVAVVSGKEAPVNRVLWIRND